MSAFESLQVYAKVKYFNSEILELLEECILRPYVRDQHGRAALSIRLNIAECSSRLSLKDKRHFLVIARGSAFESVSLLEYLKDKNINTEEKYLYHCANIEEISKMLFAMNRKLE